MSAHLPALDHGVMDPAPVLYVIRIHGHLGATVLFAFPALAPQRHGADTVPPRHHRRERGQNRGAEVAVDPDRIPGGR